MTQFNYPSLAAMSSRVIADSGALCVINHPTGTAYNPATGTTTPTMVSTPSKATVIAFPQAYIDGTLILQGDQKALCDPGVPVMQGDTFTWQGKTYKVINVKPLAPAGLVLLYEAQIRG